MQHWLKCCGAFLLVLLLFLLLFSTLVAIFPASARNLSFPPNISILRCLIALEVGQFLLVPTFRNETCISSDHTHWIVPVPSIWRCSFEICGIQGRQEGDRYSTRGKGGGILNMLCGKEKTREGHRIAERKGQSAFKQPCRSGALTAYNHHWSLFGSLV